ncbi:MAG: ADP-ribosylglycohydrolase family protein [Planctomycetia bacterium]|nr:ADP-ribosylglycohydrolase family protein [Planctomycetia bacterium]
MHPIYEKPRIYDCIVGWAAGDALGSWVEFLSLTEIRDEYGPDGVTEYRLVDGIAEITDDTQMTLFTLAGILLWERERSVNPGARLETALYDAYQDWYATQEPDDSRWKMKYQPRTKLYQNWDLHRREAPGCTCLSALQSEKMGTLAWPINDSKGNGGVMRVAPIGFWFSRQEQSVEETMVMGAVSAAITHGHPLGYISSALMAGLVNECIYGDSATLKEAVLRSKMRTEQIFAGTRYLEELLTLVDRAIQLSETREEPVSAMSKLSKSWLAESAVAIAIYCALKNVNDFGHGIITAVNFSGDSDTVAAITGNILGAWVGIEKIDEKWITPLKIDRFLMSL